MAGLMTKDRLKGILLNLDKYSDEPDVIDAWAASWRLFFEVAAAESSVAVPSYVVDETTQLKIGINSLLGVANNSGNDVLVTCNITGESQLLVSAFDTENYVRTVDLLGQTSPSSTTLSDYAVSLPGKSIEISALGTPESAMKSKLDGVTQTNAAAAKFAAGVTAWWDELEANPATYFTTASGIVPPTALSSLESDLQAAFDQNNADIDANGNITNDQAMDRVAQAFVTGNTGGILQEPGSPPVEYTIE